MKRQDAIKLLEQFIESLPVELSPDNHYDEKYVNRDGSPTKPPLEELITSSYDDMAAVVYNLAVLHRNIDAKARHREMYIHHLEQWRYWRKDADEMAIDRRKALKQYRQFLQLTAEKWLPDLWVSIFRDRLTISNGQLEYTAGQFYELEVWSVLAYKLGLHNYRLGQELAEKPITGKQHARSFQGIKDIAYRAGSMYFHASHGPTRLVSDIYNGDTFVLSVRSYDGGRDYNVMQLAHDGRVVTLMPHVGSLATARKLAQRYVAGELVFTPHLHLEGGKTTTTIGYYRYNTLTDGQEYHPYGTYYFPTVSEQGVVSYAYMETADFEAMEILPLYKVVVQPDFYFQDTLGDALAACGDDSTEDESDYDVLREYFSKRGYNRHQSHLYATIIAAANSENEFLATVDVYEGKQYMQSYTARLSVYGNDNEAHLAALLKDALGDKARRYENLTIPEGYYSIRYK